MTNLFASLSLNKIAVERRGLTSRVTLLARNSDLSDSATGGGEKTVSHWEVRLHSRCFALPEDVLLWAGFQTIPAPVRAQGRGFKARFLL